MKRETLLSIFLGAAAGSLSSLAAAAWETGPCSGGGSGPCIETKVNGSTYHFNGSGWHAGEWHGLPTSGVNFQFSGSTQWNCGSIWECTQTWSGKVKKCQDSGGDWRIGIQVSSADVVPGNFYCNFVTLGGFPRYLKGSPITNHCPFTDDCDNFIPYDPSVSTYTANVGPIDIEIFGSPQLANGHVHSVVFTPGVSANFAFSSDFYDCDENDQGCSMDGTLTLDNATSLDIH